MQTRKQLWMKRNAPILNVTVPFKQEKNSALTNVAILTQKEVLAPASMQAVTLADNGTVA